MKIVRLFLVLFFVSCMGTKEVIAAVQKKCMNILMVVPCFPKIHDVCMLNQITGLIDRGHDVTIYAESKGNVDNVQESVITYDLLSKTIFEFPSQLNDFDIVVFQLGHKARNIKKTHGFTGKIVVCMRGYDITGFIAQNPHAYDELFTVVDLFMPVCHAFKDRLIRLGCASSKIVVHHSGIDCSLFTFRKKQLLRNARINIISAGRFVEKKGFEYAIKAIAQLVKKYPAIRYRIIGDGILKKQHQKLIRRLGVERYITLEGWHPHAEYNQILDSAHIFIMPSVTGKDNDQEGIPNVVKEAMAKGVIVVATNHSGMSEIIEHNKSGFLVSERNSYALSFVVESIIKNFNTLHDMALRARDSVEREFDTEMLNDRLEEIFLHMLENNA